jgi:hypothetical protein
MSAQDWRDTLPSEQYTPGLWRDWRRRLAEAAPVSGYEAQFSWEPL